MIRHNISSLLLAGAFIVAPVSLGIAGPVDAAYAPEASVITIQGGRDRPESRQVVRPVGARSRNAMNFAGAFAAKHMKSASTCTMPHPGSKRGCSTSFGKFGNRLEARAQAAGGTGANDALRAITSHES